MDAAPFRVLALVSQKGGSGKTTLAVHLAVALGASGRRVALIDTDPQGSATAWYGLRQAGEPRLIAAPAERIRGTLAAAKAGGAVIAIIDTKPSVSPDVRRRPVRPTWR